MKKVENKKSIFNKILFILGILVSIFILVFGLLHLMHAYKYADDMFMLGLMLLMFIQVLEYWKKNKKTAMFSLVVGIFILIMI